MSDGDFDRVLDAHAYFEQTHPESIDAGSDDAVPDSTLLRIERIEEVELPAATHAETRVRLLAELDRLYDAFGSVDDWREDETAEERNERLRTRDAATRQSDRPGGTGSDPWPIEQEWAKERGRELRRVPQHGELGADAAAVRRFVRAELEAVGLDVEAHLRRPPRGKPTAAARAVREALAPIVAAARAKGATLEALAAATNRTVSTVEALLRDAPNPEIAAPLGEGLTPP